jgi:lipid-binding SYLF domain-containing protein
MKRTLKLGLIVAVVGLGLIITSQCGGKVEPPASTEAVETTENTETQVSPAEAPAESAEEPAPEREWESMKQASKAAKIDEAADEALEELFAEKVKAKELYEKSYGWAVFDNLKLAFGFSGGGGNGVAVRKDNGERTYMKMGTGGVGVGLGIAEYQVVFLFEDPQTFDNFVEKGWQADAGATAAAGTSAAEAKTNFVNGLAIYQLTEKGLMANADIAGTKYWKNKKLND